MFRVIYKYIRENCLFLINIFCFQDQKLSNQPIKKIISGLINGINMVVPSNKSLSLLWLPFIMHLLHDRDWYIIIFTSHSKWGSYYRSLKTLCQSFHGWEVRGLRIWSWSYWIQAYAICLFANDLSEHFLAVS